METEGTETDGMHPNQFIQCDGPDCNAFGPSRRCPTCRRTYYCSNACQRAHWQNGHEEICHVAVNQIGTSVEAYGGMEHPKNKANPAYSSGCRICLETAKFPFVCNVCRHTFCTDCLVYRTCLLEDGLHLGTNSGIPCPGCKSTPMENSEAKLFDKAKLLLAEADLPTTNNRQKGKLKYQALHCIRIALQADNPSMLLHLRNIIVLVDVGKYGDAIEAIGDITSSRFAAWKWMYMTARALERNEYFDEAYRIYNKVTKKTSLAVRNSIAISGKSHNAYHELYLQSTVGEARCMYKNDNLEMAIRICSAAVSADRFFPGFNQYYSLSLKKQGKLDEAIKYMARAILYETPWNPNEKHKANVWKEYHEMCTEMDSKSERKEGTEEDNIEHHIGAIQNNANTAGFHKVYMDGATRLDLVFPNEQTWRDWMEQTEHIKAVAVMIYKHLSDVDHRYYRMSEDHQQQGAEWLQSIADLCAMGFGMAPSIVKSEKEWKLVRVSMLEYNDFVKAIKCPIEDGNIYTSSHFQDIEKSCFKYIQCDSPRCSRFQPRYVCAVCRRTYYCSKNCRKDHWTNSHRVQCIAASTLHGLDLSPEEIVSDHAVAGNDARRIEESFAKPDRCRLCSKESAVDPYTASCHDVFCTTCIMRHQLQEEVKIYLHRNCIVTGTGIPCPKCGSTDTENVMFKLLHEAELLRHKANVQEICDEQRVEMRKKALWFVDRVIKVDNSDILAYRLKAAILVDLKLYAQALHVIDEALEENRRRWEHPIVQHKAKIGAARRSGNNAELRRQKALLQKAIEAHWSTFARTRLTTQSVYEYLFQKCHVLETQGEYEQASRQYWELDGKASSLYGEYKESKNPQIIRARIGSVRCHYKAGKTTMAILTCDKLIKADRHTPGAHTYKALSLQKEGKPGDAIPVLARAVVYETAWNTDETHNGRVRQLYNDLCDFCDNNKGGVGKARSNRNKENNGSCASSDQNHPGGKQT